MNRKAISNLQQSAAAHIYHVFTVCNETQSCTAAMEKTIFIMAKVHEVACRDLAIGKPAARVERLEEAIQIARIYLERWIGELTCPASDLDQALAILKNVLAEEEGYG